jgi:hypothetical protein
VATYYGWPHCTYPGCGHQNLYAYMADLHRDRKAHPDWVDGEGAFCSCHDPLGTYPCTWATHLATYATGAQLETYQG